MNIFEEIKSHVSMIDVARNYGLSLKKAGSRYKALCPFHKEDTPSLVIYEYSFCCYGCHTAGDAIKFVALLFNISNLEAAKKINDDFRIGLDIEGSKPTVLNTEESFKRDFMNGIHIWRNEALKTLSDLFQAISKILKCYDMETAWDDEEFPAYVQLKADLDRWTDTLIHGNAEEWFYVYKELTQKGVKIIETK